MFLARYPRLHEKPCQVGKENNMGMGSPMLGYGVQLCSTRQASMLCLTCVPNVDQVRAGTETVPTSVRLEWHAKGVDGVGLMLKHPPHARQRCVVCGLQGG